MAEAKEGAPSLTGKDANLIFPCSGAITNNTPRDLYFPDIGLHLKPNTAAENYNRAQFPSIGHWLRFHSDIEQLTVLNEWVDPFHIMIDAEFVQDLAASPVDPVSMELISDASTAASAAAEGAQVAADPATDQGAAMEGQEQGAAPVDGAGGESTPVPAVATEGSADSQDSAKAAAKTAAKSKK